MDNEKRQALSVYRMEQAEETLTAAKMCLEYIYIRTVLTVLIMLPFMQ